MGAFLDCGLAKIMIRSVFQHKIHDTVAQATAQLAGFGVWVPSNKVHDESLIICMAWLQERAWLHGRAAASGTRGLAS